MSKLSDTVNPAAPQWWMPRCCALFATSQDCPKNLYTNSSDLQWRRGIWSRGKENSNALCAATIFDGTLDLLEILQLQSVPHWGIVSLQAIQHHQRRGSMTKQFSAAMDAGLTVHLSIHFAKWTEDIVTISQISVCRRWYSCARTIPSWGCANSPRCWLHPHISQSLGLDAGLVDYKKLRRVHITCLRFLASRKTSKTWIWKLTTSNGIKVSSFTERAHRSFTDLRWRQYLLSDSVGIFIPERNRCCKMSWGSNIGTAIETVVPSSLDKETSHCTSTGSFREELHQASASCYY